MLQPNQHPSSCCCISQRPSWWGVLLLLWLLPVLSSGSTTYFQVKAVSGDGIYSLLRRFQLNRYSCNFSKFYELNKLKKNAPLYAGRNYYLPILIYTFNDRTIRSSIGIDNWDLALQIQDYNEEMLVEGLRNESFKANKQLWVPHHLLNCDKPDLNLPAPEPVSETSGEDAGFEKLSSPGDQQFPIFGPKYAYTPLASRRLRGKIFYIVSGHGGPDPGAIGKRGSAQLCEDEYAYDVALRLCRRLIENGATAYMITRDPNDGIRDEKLLRCDEDERIWGGDRMPVSQKPRLFQRSDLINKLYEQNRKLGFTDQNVVVIHVDSRSRSQQVDLFFYYQNGQAASKTLAYQLHQTMAAKYRMHRSSGNYHGSVTTRDLHMLREIKCPTVYIELGNIRNNFDQQRVVLETNRQALANWLYEGLSK